jgi:lipopolysaccharide/colanic/teichoic acid biosynthesis glycosyltransferase
MDIVAGALGLAAMGVCVPFVAAFNALACPGPLFYRQTRVGWGGREFEMLKFRSMIPDAEAAEGAVWACAGDARVTPIGRFMRKTRLDELPQMWNVLKGEMSVIGPRPERPEFVEELAQALPFYRARHAVRPGITGWAQVRFNYGNSVEDAKVKLEYDIYYVKHVGPFLDLRIALQTVWVMLGLRGT